MSHYEILGAARSFLHTLNKASAADLDKVYQTLANEVNDSHYAERLEPKAGALAAVFAEINRRCWTHHD